jgi:hypothetical protein
MDKLKFQLGAWKKLKMMYLCLLLLYPLELKAHGFQTHSLWMLHDQMWIASSTCGYMDLDSSKL